MRWTTLSLARKSVPLAFGAGSWTPGLRLARRDLSVLRASSSSSSSSSSVVVDLRSDTVTSPSRAMLQAALTAPTGDDVMGEDPTVLELQDFVADMFGKEAGLYVPTGTMSNLVALLAHCHGRASEIIVGATSHVCLWEGGNVANMGGIHSRQLREDPTTAELYTPDILDAIRRDNDDHFAETRVLCLENSQNSLGGVALPVSYVTRMGALAHDHGLQLHLDGARICNAAIAHGVSPREMCAAADSVSVCLSKGLGAPLGSVLVGNKEFIRLAKRARKRCGGGMRQAGVVAAMGLYAIQNNVERLADDHTRAKQLGQVLYENGFVMPRDGQIDTNIVYFALPPDCGVSNEEFTDRLLSEFGVKVSGGYSRGGQLFRAATHLDVDDEGVARAAEAMVQVVTT